MKYMTQIQSLTSKLASSDLRKKLSDFGIAHLAVFGSYARSEAHKDSDLDLLLDLHPDDHMTLGTLEEIEELLKKELSLPSIDFVMRRSISP